MLARIVPCGIAIKCSDHVAPCALVLSHCCAPVPLRVCFCLLLFWALLCWGRVPRFAFPADGALIGRCAQKPAHWWQCMAAALRHCQTLAGAMLSAIAPRACELVPACAVTTRPAVAIAGRSLRPLTRLSARGTRCAGSPAASSSSTWPPAAPQQQARRQLASLLPRRACSTSCWCVAVMTLRSLLPAAEEERLCSQTCMQTSVSGALTAS